MANPSIESVSEDRLLRLALDDMNIAYAHYDASDRLAYWNAAYEALNYKIRPMIKKGALFPDLLAELVVRGQILDVGVDPTGWVAERLRNRGSGAFSYRHLGDGRIFLARERRMADGGVMGIWVDVTDAEDGDEDLIGVFARDVGHRLNNLLQTVKGNAELARLGEDDANARLGDVLDAADDGAEMVRLLLAAAGHATLTAAPMSLNAAFEAARPDDHRIKAALAADLPDIRGDEAWLQRAIKAAISLVAAAAPPQTTLNVTTNTARLVAPRNGLSPDLYASLSVQSAAALLDPPPPSPLERSATESVARRMGGVFLLEDLSGEGRRARLLLPFA